MKKIVIGGAAVAAMVAVVVEVLPDLRRYLRIRRMWIVAATGGPRGCVERRTRRPATACRAVRPGRARL